MKFYEEVKNIRRRQYLDCDIIRDEERFRSTMFRKEWSTWGRNRLSPTSLIPSSSHVASCVSPICPISRSIASADMKQSCGARPARFCSRSMPCIVVNHKRDDGGSVSVAHETSRPMDPTTIELPDPPIYAIDAELGRDGRAILIIRGWQKLGLFRQSAWSAPPLSLGCDLGYSGRNYCGRTNGINPNENLPYSPIKPSTAGRVAGSWPRQRELQEFVALNGGKIVIRNQRQHGFRRLEFGEPRGLPCCRFQSAGPPRTGRQSRRTRERRNIPGCRRRAAACR